MEVNIWKK